MTVSITLNLPEHLVEHAEYFGQVTQRDINEVLVDTLEMMWPTLGEVPDIRLYPSVSTMSNQEVLSLADQQMDPIQNQRLSDLQSKGKVSGLLVDERYELLALMQIYQIGLLRKSQGLAEVVRRGLREPLPA